MRLRPRHRMPTQQSPEPTPHPHLPSSRDDASARSLCQPRIMSTAFDTIGARREVHWPRSPRCAPHRRSPTPAAAHRTLWLDLEPNSTRARLQGRDTLGVMLAASWAASWHEDESVAVSVRLALPNSDWGLSGEGEGTWMVPQRAGAKGNPELEGSSGGGG
jgi:hypothetical protein